MFQQLNGMKKLSDLEATVKRGDFVIQALERGEI
jgi:hypothetical protein